MAANRSRWAPLAGVAFVVLLVLGAVLAGSEPRGGSSAARIVAFYTVHRTTVKASDLLTALAVVVGLLFYGYLRDCLSGTGASARLAATAFGGAVVFAVGGLTGAGAQYALADIPARLAPGAAQALNLLQNDLAGFTVNAGAAVLLIASGSAVLAGRRLPAWTGWLAVVLGLLTLVPVPNSGALTAGVWTLLASILLIIRGGSAASAESRDAGHPASSAAR
jgi:hypothetical protein